MRLPFHLVRLTMQLQRCSRCVTSRWLAIEGKVRCACSSHHVASNSSYKIPLLINNSRPLHWINFNGFGTDCLACLWCIMICFDWYWSYNNVYEWSHNSMNTTMYLMSLAEHIRLKPSRVCHCKWYHRHRVRQQEGIPPYFDCKVQLFCIYLDRDGASRYFPDQITSPSTLATKHYSLEDLGALVLKTYSSFLYSVL